ncbi:hypothetical protein [Hymenobacter crusticola]|uniref:Uncharacterized protein n=1 Tax=Hymenobacter crusticola TaxID=1770526 RepID=A0A243WI72_9BACT|nr:hypothetical protein [Hymenobacter crusticola]OUJ74709.1 hypothetical protein BXP70_08070 [Hymenobacter crusticola]
MARLIDTQSLPELPSQITLSPGDVLVLQASGGYVQTGDDVLEMLGAYQPGLLQAAGTVLSPMGAPGTVLLRALQPGQATVNVVMGDPWFSPETHTLGVIVEV